MYLSAAACYGRISVIRDGDFLNLGFVHCGQEGLLSFVESERLMAAVLSKENITAVLTTPLLAPSAPARVAVGVCDEPRVAFAMLHNELTKSGFYWDDFPTSIDPTARVHGSAWIAEKNVRIGPDTAVGPRAAILERCVVGSEVEVGAGCVLGGVGFQTVRSQPTMLELNTQAGW